MCVCALFTWFSNCGLCAVRSGEFLGVLDSTNEDFSCIFYSQILFSFNLESPRFTSLEIESTLFSPLLFLEKGNRRDEQNRPKNFVLLAACPRQSSCRAVQRHLQLQARVSDLHELRTTKFSSAEFPLCGSAGARPCARSRALMMLTVSSTPTTTSTVSSIAMLPNCVRVVQGITSCIDIASPTTLQLLIPHKPEVEPPAFPSSFQLAARSLCAQLAAP